MEWYIVVAVVVVGFIVGFMNTLAGSGSLLSLPLLMFLGLPATVANGTNRIGILLQSITAASSFQKQKVFEWKDGIKLSLPAIVGATIGAAFAVKLTNEIMQYIIGSLLIIMFFLMLYKPSMWLDGKNEIKTTKFGFWQVVIFFFIGLYGGFIQAGVGFFLLTGLVVGAGLDLLKANAIKILVVLFYTPVALAIFIYNSQVDFTLGLLLGGGNIIGAYVASKAAIKRGNVFIKNIILVVIFISALELLGVYEYIGKLLGIV